MEIREFAAGDYPTVRALWEQVGLLKSTSADTLPGLLACAARNPGLFLVGVDPKAGVIATVIGAFDGRRAYIYHVAVDPDYRRLGYARRLVREVMGRLWALGAEKIALRVSRRNQAAIELYQSLGMSYDEAVIMMAVERETP